MAKSKIVINTIAAVSPTWPGEILIATPILVDDGCLNVAIVVGDKDDKQQVIFFGSDNTILYADMKYLLEKCKFIRYMKSNESCTFNGVSIE